MLNLDVYLYGMTLVSTMNLLKGDFPELDTYGEIKESYILPGGETGSCSVVLASLGCSVRIDGNYQGKTTVQTLEEYLGRKFGVDLSRFYVDETFDGVRDMILIDAHTRTCFGTFGAYFSNEKKRWNKPVKQDIIDAKVVGLDPFFFKESELVAEYCSEVGRKFVTIDCSPDSILNRLCEVNIISNEYIRTNYPGRDLEELFKEYTDNTNGLIIFTFGGRDIMFGRKGKPANHFKPYQVKVQSTLGAGDTFKAGAIYGVLKNMEDEQIVSFAAATAGTVCSRFPLSLNPPTLDMINSLISSRP